ncbi:hypothetical protein KUTeg_002175 [Tegillarca granosa]|uniref:Uncharacterized protein n=1 Tax=Tegillarca granosa TaxID=220873 RepID=A0ABQ9FTK5_TEGGR|nr:hypothetical protein KUTeg_002175 [Tegillarca granosa]
MGNKHSCCVYGSPKGNRNKKEIYKPEISRSEEVGLTPNDVSTSSVHGIPQHISEREILPEDNEADPSLHPSTRPIFSSRSQSELNKKYSIHSCL